MEPLIKPQRALQSEPVMLECEGVVSVDEDEDLVEVRIKGPEGLVDIWVSADILHRYGNQDLVWVRIPGELVSITRDNLAFHCPEEKYRLNLERRDIRQTIPDRIREGDANFLVKLPYFTVAKKYHLQDCIDHQMSEKHRRCFKFDFSNPFKKEIRTLRNHLRFLEDLKDENQELKNRIASLERAASRKNGPRR